MWLGVPHALAATSKSESDQCNHDVTTVEFYCLGVAVKQSTKGSLIPIDEWNLDRVLVVLLHSTVCVGEYFILTLDICAAKGLIIVKE